MTRDILILLVRKDLFCVEFHYSTCVSAGAKCSLTVLGTLSLILLGTLRADDAMATRELPFLQDYDVELPNFTFHGQVTTKFISLSEL